MSIYIEHFIYNKVCEDGVVRKQDFNMKRVIRGDWNKDGSVYTILLDDGHEESVPVGKDNKGNIIKQRIHLASQIELVGEDIEKYFKLIEGES